MEGKEKGNLEDYDTDSQTLQPNLSLSRWLTSAGDGQNLTPTGLIHINKKLLQGSYSPSEAPGTVPVDAGIAQALVHLWVAAGVMGSLRAYTAETIHIVDARCTLATGIGGTLINVNVTSLPCREGRQFLSNSKCLGNRYKTEIYCLDAFICTDNQMVFT